MGHHRTVRTPSLPKPALAFLVSIPLGLVSAGCARKGDPIPRPRSEAQACQVQWKGPRLLEVTLPLKDIKGNSLVGLETIRVYHLALGSARPTPAEVLARGEVVLEQRRPDLPSPGKRFDLDLKGIGRPPGWIVVAAVRVGEVVGVPSETLPWFHPAL